MAKRKAEFQTKKSVVLVGEVAEYIRTFFAKREAKPPGLQTSVNPDGSMSIIADNPDVGVQLQVVVAPLYVNPTLPSQMGIGPTPPTQNQPEIPPALPGTPSPGIGPG